MAGTVDTMVARAGAAHGAAGRACASGADAPEQQGSHAAMSVEVVSAERRASAEFLALVPRDFARRHLLVSAGVDGDGAERLLVAARTDRSAVFNVGTRLRRPVRTEVCEAEGIARLIDEAYAGAFDSRGIDRGGKAQEEGDATACVDGMAADIDRLLLAADRDLLATSGKGEVVRLVDAILFEALGRRASDVHVQPLARRTLVRYRVDGVLHTARELSASLTQPVVSRIKVMGRMDIAERRLAQDGRATVTIGPAGMGSDSGAGRGGTASGRSIDLRISTFPTSCGERAVVRLLESRGALAHASTLGTLGMPEHVRGAYLERADRANGIVLVTGPTGSGKTTTLYATLRWLSAKWSGELNVMTIEDPIEYELSEAGIAISQGQVNAKKGITFATGLRHILRQDPDVIMVGEVRDAETARIAIQASLTGHLVFSTLHTNDSAGAVARLMDLGVEPYLIGSSLSAVLAQRLVRRVHAACGGRGCAECFGSGLLGRIGLFELLAVTEGVRERIGRGASAAELREAALGAGMRTLEREGRRLIAEGVTSELEIARVVHGADGQEPVS